jgi:ribosomal protein L37AE/L43A
MNNMRGHASCPTCGAHGLLRVSMNMEDGAVTYWTCADCETSGWQRADTIVSREAALARIPRR